MSLEKYRPTETNQPPSIEVKVIDSEQSISTTQIAAEYPLTIYINKTAIVTLMTLGQEPEALCLGYLINQGLISSIEDIKAITVDWESSASVVTLSEEAVIKLDPLKERTVTSGCGQGTMYGNLIEKTKQAKLANDSVISQKSLYKILELIRSKNSIYKKAGAVHGCALFKGEKVIYFFEDVGRHNAVDTIAGRMWLDNEGGHDKIFYTTGRLTSEMVIKCAQMEIPILVSRSGVTHMGWKIAKDVNLTMIGRAKGKHFLIFSGKDRFIFQYS